MPLFQIRIKIMIKISRHLLKKTLIPLQKCMKSILQTLLITKENKYYKSLLRHKISLFKEVKKCYKMKGLRGLKQINPE